MAEYEDWFRKLTGFEPHPWQAALGRARTLEDRLLRVPTGFGKTAGVVLAWLYHAVAQGDQAWPRRLVLTLPMRVLVEQTETAIEGWLEAAGLADQVGLHVLMGGTPAGAWALSPERPAILVGTQDMLLSRALNRGYAAARARWPVDFGLLHHDALWVFDEIQLMDVGLATSAQLHAFREADAASKRGRIRPVATWWMSATLRPDWLATVDLEPAVAPLSNGMARIEPDGRIGPLWEIEKALVRREDVTDPREIARTTLDRHSSGRLSLVVVNRVRTAAAVFDELDKELSEGRGSKRARKADAPELRLVHSRFRGAERKVWSRTFLSRDADVPEAGRIIVATQVVEAGVDLSAELLVTELAPWPSLVQRFGRAARYPGERGEVVVVGAVPHDDGRALPYTRAELEGAHDALDRLLGDQGDVSPRSLESFEEELARGGPGQALLSRLYPYEPVHVLRRRDLDELFDTAPDLSGNDLDVSRYIRSGEERDVTLFWRGVEGDPKALPVGAVGSVDRAELCPAPIGEARTWLSKHHFYVLDYVEGVWARGEAWRLRPGMRVLVPVGTGGYDPERGFDPGVRGSVPPVSAPRAEDDLARHFEAASETEEDDSLSMAAWKSIATHGREAGEEVRTLAANLGLPARVADLLDLAARWHDAGKVHPVFQRAIGEEARGRAGNVGARRDLAKAPEGAWRRPPYPDRPGFRHELASTLALLELLRRTDSTHGALLGPHLALMEATGLAPQLVDPPDVVSPDDPLASELSELSPEEVDLVAYLVCAHHGKVRCAWTGTPHDLERGHGDVHGVREGDRLPAFELADSGGTPRPTPELVMSLSAAEMGLGERYGASWTERVSRLRQSHGPFMLAYLEAILRAADVRASRLTTGASA